MQKIQPRIKDEKSGMVTQEEKLKEALQTIDNYNSQIQRVKEGFPVPGSNQDVKRNIEQLREASGFFLEGSARRNFEKALDLVETYVDTKDKLAVFGNALEQMKDAVDLTQVEQTEIKDLLKQTLAVVNTEFTARTAQRARENETLDNLDAYIKNWT